MLALVGRRLTMYYGIIAQIVFRHIPGLYYYYYYYCCTICKQRLQYY